MSQIEPAASSSAGMVSATPSLITVGGLRAIQQAEVILYDNLAPQAVLTEARRTPS